MPELDVNGAVLYYETHGHISDPAVLLIHAGVANLRMWDCLVPVLDRDHFVIRYDTRGFGNTSSRDVDFSDREDASDLLDHLGIARATVIGCSRGGGIAIDLALESPDRVAGLATIGSGPSGFPDLEPSDREHEILDAMDRAFAAEDWAALNELEVRLWSIGPTRDQARLDPEFVELAYSLNRSNLARVGERPRPERLDPPACDRLVDLRMPTLVTVGESDVTEELAAYEFLVATIPKVTSARFADAAHLPSVERPEAFNRVLGGWLRLHDL